MFFRRSTVSFDVISVADNYTFDSVLVKRWVYAAMDEMVSNGQLGEIEAVPKTVEVQEPITLPADMGIYYIVL